MRFLKTLLQNASRDQIATLAAALAYSTALSIGPLMVLTTFLLSSLGFEWREEILQVTREWLGRDTEPLLRTILKEQPHARSIRGLSILTLGLSAGIVFLQLKSSLDQIFGAPGTSSLIAYVLRRLISLMMAFAFVLFTLVSITVGTLIPTELHLLTSLAIYVPLFAALFHWLPDRCVDWKPSWIGAALTAVFFISGKTVLSGAVAQMGFASLYGAAGTVITLLLWVYYSALVVFLGAEIVQILQERQEQEKEIVHEHPQMRKLWKYLRQGLSSHPR